MWIRYLESRCSWRGKRIPKSCLCQNSRVEVLNTNFKVPLMSGKTFRLHDIKVCHFFLYVCVCGNTCRSVLYFTSFAFQMLATHFHLQHKQTEKYRPFQRISKAAFVNNKSLVWNGSSAHFCAETQSNSFFYVTDIKRERNSFGNEAIGETTPNLVWMWFNCLSATFWSASRPFKNLASMKQHIKFGTRF